MRDEKNETFGKRLFQLRRDAGLSQLQLAKRIGSSHGSIQNYENNSLPKGEYAIKLAEVFGCSIDWLLTGSDVKKQEGDCCGNLARQTMPQEDLQELLSDHYNILQRFIDPKSGKDAIEILLEIEDLSPKDFQRCIGFLEARLYDLKQQSKSGPLEPDEIEVQKKTQTS